MTTEMTDWLKVDSEHAVSTLCGVLTAAAGGGDGGDGGELMACVQDACRTSAAAAATFVRRTTPTSTSRTGRASGSSTRDIGAAPSCSSYTSSRWRETRKVHAVTAALLANKTEAAGIVMIASRPLENNLDV